MPESIRTEWPPPPGPDFPPDPENAVEKPVDYDIEDQGAIPLIAHLIWPDREEWRAVIAKRWARRHVFITWPPTATERGGSAWLRIEDVTRVVVKERETAKPPTDVEGPPAGLPMSPPDETT